MKNGELPAFQSSATDLTTFHYGLTKREYFAGLAMQGLLSNPEWMKEYKTEKYLMQNDIVSKVSIEYADSLLKDLEL